jgi:hypothetical protein
MRRVKEYSIFIERERALIDFQRGERGKKFNEAKYKFSSLPHPISSNKLQQPVYFFFSSFFTLWKPTHDADRIIFFLH